MGVKGNAETDYRKGNVNITASNIGLGNVDNTSDLNKPISTAQAAKNTQYETDIAANTTSITTEANARASADTNLQTNIDNKQDILTAGSNITISADNIISATASPLTPATTNTLGGIIVGDNLTITTAGVLS